MKLTSTFRRFLCLLTSLCLPLFFKSQAEDLEVIYHVKTPAVDLLNGRVRRILPQPFWNPYVERRCREWTNVATIAVTILGASPSLLQMPGTNGDPLTRCLVYIFIFRMIAVIPSAMVLVYYFRKDQFRTEDFAIKWFEVCDTTSQDDRSLSSLEKNATKNRDSYLYMPWTIFALPFILFSWGIIFLILALFSSVWRGGLYPNPPADANLEVHYPTIVLIRITVTLMSVIDFGCIAWLVVTLKRWQGLDRHDPN